MKMIDFHITRVVTRDAITDAFQGLRNLVGKRLKGYESRIEKTITEMLEEMRDGYIVNWYRISIDPMTEGSIMITVYGEGVPK